MKQRSAQIGPSTKTRNQNLSLLLFALPALAVYALFKLYPAFSGIFYAMTDWNGVDKGWSFIGLENYARVLQDEYFWQSILFTLKYVIVMVVVANVIALTLAVAIETRPGARGLFRTIFYMPNMISMVIGGYMWMFIFTKVLYYFVDNFDGFSFLDHMWIGDPRYSFLAIIIVAAWGAVGYLMIIYMAAIQGVPESIKEASVLDGANAWQRFWKVEFPMIRHAVTICVFWTLNSAFQVFDVIFTLTRGGPGRATQSVAMNIYEEAFRGNIQYGYATAKSTVLFILVLAITAIQLSLMRRREEEL
ncbi:MAG: sugar ABC transporter permease [Christensenella sp.]|nr:sugar ABC transporter permease [Christensenella sp.]